MAEYQLLPDTATGPNTTVLRVADQAYIPDDPANVDRQKYDEWLAAGNVPDPAPVAAAIVPSEIAAYQFWAQAAILGKITETAAVNAMNGNLPATIDALIAALPIAQRFRARMLFRGATFKRAEPLVAEKVRDTWVIVVDDFFRDAALL